MYNRYIPKTGGGYICQKVSDIAVPFPDHRHSSAQEQRHPEKPEAQHPREQTYSCGTAPPKKHSFLQRLLPRNLELDDLLILLILLLLLLDSNEDDDSLTLLLAVIAFLILQ